MQLMNLVMSVLPNAGSGSVSRFGTSLRLGILTRSPKLTETVKTANVQEIYRIDRLSTYGSRRLKILDGCECLALEQVVIKD
jgi:hypothetical protein